MSLALILGAVGLYGVLSSVLTQLIQEIGLRMALGATHREVRWMVVRQGGRLALIGVVSGVVAAVGATRVLESLASSRSTCPLLGDVLGDGGRGFDCELRPSPEGVVAAGEEAAVIDSVYPGHSNAGYVSYLGYCGVYKGLEFIRRIGVAVVDRLAEALA